MHFILWRLCSQTSSRIISQKNRPWMVLHQEQGCTFSRIQIKEIINVLEGWRWVHFLLGQALKQSSIIGR